MRPHRLTQQPNKAPLGRKASEEQTGQAQEDKKSH